MNFAVFDVDGVILRTGNAPAGAEQAQAGDGEFVYLGDADDALHYIDPVTHELREKNEMVLSVNGTTITGLPPKAQVLVAGTLSEPIMDGECELEFDFPGTYPVVVRAPTYAEAQVEVVYEG